MIAPICDTMPSSTGRLVWPADSATAFLSTPPALAVDGVAPAVQIRFASARVDWVAAIDLVTAAYRRKGFESAAAGVRFPCHLAMPDSRTIIAEQGGRVVATMSTVLDTLALDLPCEVLYAPEVAALRAAGRHLAETVCLADVGLPGRDFLRVFLDMQRLAWACNLSLGVDATVITVNPRHVPYYVRVLGFEVIGGRKEYAAVSGHPAVALCGSPAMMRERVPPMYERVFQPVAAGLSAGEAVPRDVAMELAERSTQTTPRDVCRALAAVAAGSGRRW